MVTHFCATDPCPVCLTAPSYRGDGAFTVVHDDSGQWGIGPYTFTAANQADNDEERTDG